MREMIAHTMLLPEKTSNTARPTKRTLIGAHEAAVRDDERHREACDKGAVSAPGTNMRV
jgi:hypothetical protein